MCDLGGSRDGRSPGWGQCSHRWRYNWSSQWCLGRCAGFTAAHLSSRSWSWAHLHPHSSPRLLNDTCRNHWKTLQWITSTTCFNSANTRTHRCDLQDWAHLGPSGDDLRRRQAYTDTWPPQVSRQMKTNRKNRRKHIYIVKISNRKKAHALK